MHLDGADLSNALLRNEAYFTDRISVRSHLEARIRADDRLGYTYVMTGIKGDLLLEDNLLGLSKDKKFAHHLGEPDVKVSATHSDE